MIVGAPFAGRIWYELLLDMVWVLNADGQARIVRVFTATEDIYRGFSLELVHGETALRQPNAGFRVQLELSVPNVL
ncbi:MAG: hypothetical protein ACRYG7_15000 [Janthinobacterium lividum]